MLKILGSVNDADAFFARDVARRLVSVLSEQMADTKPPSVRFEVLLEVDYLKRLTELTNEHGGTFYGHKAMHVVVADNATYVGGARDLVRWVQTTYGVDVSDTMYDAEAYAAQVAQETQQALKGSTAVFIKFVIKSSSAAANDGDDAAAAAIITTPLNKIVIQLATDCPTATDNFIKLCTGEKGSTDVGSKKVELTYRNCPVHRLVPGGWFQTGDIVDGTGVNSVAAVGEHHKVQDESLSGDFFGRGMVGFTATTPHSNGSQFFITLGACGWMNHKYVGIGKVVQGFDALAAIEKEHTKNQRPVNAIIVESCGREA